jgi:hypothetical protein
MYKYTSELQADELGTNETPNVMTVGVENYGLKDILKYKIKNGVCHVQILMTRPV